MKAKSQTTTESSVVPFSIQDAISNFIKEGNEWSVSLKDKKSSKDVRSQLVRARSRDVNSQIGLRIGYSIFFGLLLGCQNIVVFWLVIRAIETNSLSNLQPVFSILVGATLFETYKIAEIMVKWSFKDINYK